MAYQYMHNMYGGQAGGNTGSHPGNHMNRGVPSPAPTRMTGNMGRGPPNQYKYMMGHNSHLMDSSMNSMAGGTSMVETLSSNGHDQGNGMGSNQYFGMPYNGQVHMPSQQGVYSMQGSNNGNMGIHGPYMSSIAPVSNSEFNPYLGPQQTGLPNSGSNGVPVSTMNVPDNGELGSMQQHSQPPIHMQQTGTENGRIESQRPLSVQQTNKNRKSSVGQSSSQSTNSKNKVRKSSIQSQKSARQLNQRSKVSNVSSNDQTMKVNARAKGVTPQLPQPAQYPSNIPYPMRKHLSNLAILRTHEIINLLNVSNTKLNDMGYWNHIVSETFTSYGLLRYSRKHQDDIRQFEFATALVPSVLRSFGSSGVSRLSVVPHQLRSQLLNNGSTFFECPRCLLTYFFSDGSYITNFTHFKGVFDNSLKIEWLDMFTYSFVPGVEWAALETKLSDSNLCKNIFKKLSKLDKGKGSKSKNAKGCIKAEKDIENHSNNSQNPEYPLFEALTQLRSQFKVFQNVSTFGIQEGFMRVLQVNDVMSYLKHLKIYQRRTGIKSPVHSLSSYVNTNMERSWDNFSDINRNMGTGIVKEPININSKSQAHSSNHAPTNSKKRSFNGNVLPFDNTEYMSYMEHENTSHKKAKY